MRAGFHLASINSGSKEQAISYFKSQLGPALNKLDANQGSIDLIDGDNNNAIPISFWPRDREDRENPPGSFIDIFVVDKILDPRVSNSYDVSVMTDMSNISEAPRARINQRDIQPGKMEEAISLYRPNAPNNVSAEPVIRYYCDVVYAYMS